MTKPSEAIQISAYFTELKIYFLLFALKGRRKNPSNHQNSGIHDKELLFIGILHFLAECYIRHDQMIKLPDVIYVASCFTQLKLLFLPITMKLRRSIIQIIKIVAFTTKRVEVIQNVHLLA